MPLCPFFVSGKCNYGSRCYNLHVDVGQAIQITAKASLGGKQWLLSCFAPFEGETELPNFIEDQSFEEVRSEFYAARANNTEHLAKQKFNQSWAQAQEMTMKMINGDQSVLAYLVDTYGVNEKRKPNTGPPTASSVTPSPFGMASATLNASAGGGGSVFGGSVTAPSFATSAVPNSGGASIFGATAAVPSNTTVGSIFGGQTMNSTAVGGGSIFGGGNTAPSTTGGSIFGASTALGTQNTSGGSIFATAANQQPSGNIFGQPQQQTSVFGGGSAQLQSQQTPANTGNIFGQSQQPQTNVFQQQQPTEQPSIFGQNATQQQQPQQQIPLNPFQNASPFGAVPNINPPIATGGNVFGNLGQNANQAAQAAIFGETKSAPPPTQAGRGGGTSFGGAPATDENAYSRADQLSEEVLLIFKQNSPFELGKIPNMPPPRETCF